MKRSRIYEMTLIALFTTLTIIGTQITIPLAFVPITMQTMFVLCSGMLLGSVKGMLSQLLYIALGLIGFPIFAGGKGGPQMILAVSFGYLIGFVVAPLAVGAVLRVLKKVNVFTVFLAGLAGTLVIDFFGIAYILTLFNTFSAKPIPVPNVFAAILLPTIPGDLLKVAILALTVPYLYRVLSRQNLLPLKAAKLSGNK